MRRYVIASTALALSAACVSPEAPPVERPNTTIEVVTPTTVGFGPEQIALCLEKGVEAKFEDGFIRRTASQECVDYVKGMFTKLARSALYWPYLTSQ